MTIRCVGCGRAIRIPDEKAENPRLKVKCTCGVVFALAEAMEAAADSAAAERAVVAPASLTPVDMALTIDPSLTQPVEPIAPAPAEPAAPAPQQRRTRPPGGWRRCINHHTEPSTHVCPKCTVGYCAACETTVRESTVICPVCEAFCVPVKKYEEGQELVRQRQRSMMEELQTIATYPLRDPMAYVMLAVFSGFFALGARLGGMLWVLGTILSMGALYGYCFYALNRVASGNLKDFMPPIGDFWEFVEPCKLGLAAFLASTGPLLLIVTWAGFSVAKSFMADAPAPIEMSVVHAQVAGEAEEATPQLSGGAMLVATLLLIPAILWKIAYTPVALTVAALSRSVLSILNPMIALDTVKRMGIVYWQAMLIYAVLAFGQWVLNFLLSFIPYLGAVVASFVDAYIYLAIGCTLGLAVFKKAPELGFD